MLDALLNGTALVLIYTAFALMALAQEDHWAAVTGGLAPPAAETRRRRRLAMAGLLAGGVLCLPGNGAGFGLLLWVLMLGAGAAAVTCTLAWKPRCLRHLAQL